MGIVNPPATQYFKKQPIKAMWVFILFFDRLVDSYNEKFPDGWDWDNWMFIAVVDQWCYQK